MRTTILGAVGAAVISASLYAQSAALSPAQSAAPSATAPALTDAQIEEFLLKAKVLKTRGTKKGVTGSLQATMSDGTLTHDAHIQIIDEEKAQFASATGVEFNFRDTWMFNIAAYKLDRLIGMNMVPPSVERRHGYNKAAFTWWVDDVLMDEGEHLKRKVDSPNLESWNQQMQLVRMFDQLIANVDRNMGNLVITRDWRLWPIDHTRAFRRNHELKTPANVTRADRAVVERMKALDRDTLKRELGKYVTTFELDALLARRDAIVKRLEGLGPAALFDRVPWAVPAAPTAPQHLIAPATIH